MIIYCDMDGVLVNFERGAELAVGHRFMSSVLDSVKKEDQERILKLKEIFWSNLPMMPDAMRLWRVITKYDAQILSAEASWDREAGVKYSRIGKMMWVKKNLGVSLNRVHIVKRSEKKYYAQSEAGSNLLIDDFKDNIIEFERAGGKTIYHQSVSHTLDQLKKHGIY